MADTWKENIRSRLSIRNNKVCIKGTRVMLSVILDCLAEGMSWDEIVTEYPSLRHGDIEIALSYAALLARNETLLLKQESS